MAIVKKLPCGVHVVTDGSSTTFDLDLNVDPWYAYPEDVTGTFNPAVRIQNFFPEGRAALPSGVVAGMGGGYTVTATISGSIVSFTFSSAPPLGDAVLVAFSLLF